MPVLCLTRPGDKPARWPKEVPPPEEDELCTARFDELFEGDVEALVTKAWSFVVPPRGKGRNGERVALKKVGDGSIVEVTVTGKKPLGRGYFSLRDRASPIPRTVTTYWRDDGLAVAVEATYVVKHQGPGYGPPTYLVVIPLDGSALDVPRPKTERDDARALNLQGMRLLKLGKLDEAQTQFVAAVRADRTFSIAHYNLASVASLRKDSVTAVFAIDQVITLARSDAEAKRALAKAKTDRDLDYIASQSPYVAQRLGRPRTPGDDWCIAAEKRARDINLVNFAAIAGEAARAIEPTAARGALAGDAFMPELSCHVRDGKSQLSVTMHVRITGKNEQERVVRIAWQLFPDGLFDATAFPEKQPTVRLQKLAKLAATSKTIIGGK